MITFADEEPQSWNEFFEQKLNEIVNKLDYLDVEGRVTYSEPFHMGGKEKSFDIEMKRKGKPYQIPEDHKCPEPKPLRKLTDTDWLNILNYYKMLFDGFKNADWDNDSVREQVASAMIKKTKKFFEENYPDLMEVKQKPIFDKEDFQ